MNISAINNYHTLENISLTPEQLLLDPRNPRITVDLTDDIEYTDKQLLSEEVQSDILKKIDKDIYHVSDLINDIKTSGFIDGTAPIIVKRLCNGNKFLVLEGNRRTTAIKHLLENSEILDANVLKTLKKINAKQFIYIPNDDYSEEEIIDIILGKIHISGPVAWGPMEKAHYIYKTYIRDITKNTGDSEFKIINTSLEHVSKFYNFKPNVIKNNLKVYRIYNQLRESGHTVDSTRFTLIDLAVNDSLLSKEYFNLSPLYTFSDIGLNRFSSLCLDDDRPVFNPQLFKNFSYIFKNGKTDDVSQIENRNTTIEDLHHEVKKRQNDSHLVSKLNAILSDLERLNLDSFSGSDEENKAITRIKNLVNGKLMFVNGELSDSQDLFGEDSTIILPSNIQAAIDMDEALYQRVIVDTIKDRANNTCVKSKIVTYILRYLNITTRSSPREMFKKKVSGHVDTMLDKCMLEEYSTSKNTRLRVLV